MAIPSNPRKSKRKFDPDDEETEPAQRPRVVTNTPQLDEMRRSEPTPETQRLYNKMRKIQDSLSLIEQLQLAGAPSGSGDNNAYLQLPSHSQAPTSPRSPSCASTTHSLKRAFDDTGIDDDESRRTKRKKAVRNGPLDEFKRAKAAFLRRIGACEDCRQRRVTCTHFDRETFEEAYRSQQQQSQASPLSPLSPFSQRPEEEPAVSPQPSNSELPALNSVGSWQTISPSRQRGASENPHGRADTGLYAELDAEWENLRRQNPSDPLRSPEPYHLSGRTRNLGNLIGLSEQFSPHPLGPAMFPIPSLGTGDSQIPIGRQINNTIYWECKHSGEYGFLSECNWQCRSVQELWEHFRQSHIPFWDQCILRKCTSMRRAEDGIETMCGMLFEDDSTTCLNRCGGNRWERWCYGSVSKTPSLTSGTSLRIGSRDGSAMSGPGAPYLQMQHPSIGDGQTQNFHMLWPGRYLGGPYPRSHHSGKEPPPAETPPREACFGNFQMYPGGCPYGRRSRSKSWNMKSSSSSSSSTVKTPFLLLLSLFSLMLVENVVRSTGIVPAILHTARNHIFLTSWICIIGGLVGMWLFKHIRFRLRYGLGPSCHSRCLMMDIMKISPRYDLEDAGALSREAAAVPGRVPIAA